MEADVEVNHNIGQHAIAFAKQIDEILLAVTNRIQNRKYPTSTYRVQLNKDCTFRRLMEFVPTIADMGFSHVYLSPFLEARPGSLHGYDIVNHARINPEIGAMDDLRHLSELLRSFDMGIIADVVPNHMSASPTYNAWWYDVLENGPASKFATYFDIEWRTTTTDPSGKVLLPILGDQFGEVLENGELKLTYDRGVFEIHYFEHQLPLAPRSYLTLLDLALAMVEDDADRSQKWSDMDHSELLSIVTSIRNLPTRDALENAKLIERRREKEIIKRRIHDLWNRSTFLRELIDRCILQVNGIVGEAASFDLLDSLLNEQAYRLSYWRVAAEEINYRRFFDINELAALRTEIPEVLMDTHQLLFELIDEGIIDGLRIDHPDGLLDPHRYLLQLQEGHFLRLCKQEFDRDRTIETTQGAVEIAESDDGRWISCANRLRELWQVSAKVPGSELARPLLIYLEKILGRDEQLPEDWTAHGTVGYEFLNAVNGVFIDQSNEKATTSFYTKFTGQDSDFTEIVYGCKRLVVRMSMASELNVLGHALARLSEQCRRTRDFTQSSLTHALQEVIAAFDVYRSYVKSGSILERDRRLIEVAINKAIERNPNMDSSIFVFLQDVLLLKFPTALDSELSKSVERFTGRFQQLTGPIMAKSVEDTAFYRFNRLVSLNEVGGDPSQFGISVEEFHEFNQARSQKFNHAMNSSSTHDTKRSEDVRARLNVLSEIPRHWKEHVQRWARWNKGLRTTLSDGTVTPSRNAEYLLYQTIVGTIPLRIESRHEWDQYIDRLQRYMIKVEREAKVETSWVRPDLAYEHALSSFIANLFAEGHKIEFRNDILDFARMVARHGTWNSLSQLVLKMTLPGIPDFYQGTEFGTFTLVDPDNRNAVDWELRSRCVEAIRSLDLEAIPTQMDDLLRQFELEQIDLLKCYVSSFGLNFRKQFWQLFQCGDYQSVEVAGFKARGVIAYAREFQGNVIVVTVGRFSAALHGIENLAPIGDMWGDTRILFPKHMETRSFQNILTGKTTVPHGGIVSVRELFDRLPISILFAGTDA